MLGVSPSSGTGLSQQSFTAAFSDTSGAGDILQAHFLFNLGLNGTNACWLIYYSGSFYLMNDGQTAWEGPLAPNSGGSFSNSQCTLFGTGSSITRSGNTFSMTVTVTFNANFWGTMASFMNAGSEEGDSSGWSQAGAWTVPVISSSVAALQNCITSSGPSDVGPKTCILTASSIPYQVTSASTLTIARSNLIITGSGTPGETILVRDSASVGAIMTPSSTSITNVTISNLTFDGNRYGPGLALNCLAGNNDYTDLDLDFGGLPQGSFQCSGWISSMGLAIRFISAVARLSQFQTLGRADTASALRAASGARQQYRLRTAPPQSGLTGVGVARRTMRSHLLVPRRSPSMVRRKRSWEISSNKIGTNCQT